jgi:signal recognition particle subunit SRP54
MQQLKKMGPLTQIMGMIPGFSQYAKEIPQEATEQQFKRIEAIINSMTLVERNDPDVLNARRRQRIAKGSGTTVQDVNELMREFKQMQKMMQQLGRGGKGGRGIPRIPGFPGM